MRTDTSILTPPTHSEPPPIDPKQLALTIAEILHNKQGTDIVILDVSGPLVIADYFVSATAKNARHARALALEVDRTLRTQGKRHRNAAGLETENPWILLDYDEVVVHVFMSEARHFYGLEHLWADVPRVPFTPAPLPAGGAPPDSFDDASIGTL